MAAVAVLRSRLYEIDRIVSRTVAYGLVIGALAGLFYATVALLPARSDLAVAASTLLVAAAFNPLRRRIRDVVDRRFNRTRFDAGQVLDRFSETLRLDTGTNDLIYVWLAAVTETMQPAAVSLWLKPSSPDSHASAAPHED